MKLFLLFLIVALANASTELGLTIEVTGSNWESLLSEGNHEWMIEFFAPWCPACKRFETTWSEFASKSAQLKIKVGSADVNANPVLSGLFSVTSLPTIYHIKDGKYRVYPGNRDLSSLVDFVANREWQKVEPTSSWLSPNSLLIKGLSLLFKVTIYFKDIYTLLTETYNYPIWAVLALFVVITIALGLLLGVVFILIIDCICPPKRQNFEEMAEIPDDTDVSEEKKDADDASKKSDAADKKEKNPVAKKKAKKDN
jgi:thiol-disulfide isomerase/thioredoxin